MVYEHLLADLSMTLKIDIETYQHGMLLNSFVKPGVQIKDMELTRPEKYDESTDEFIELTKKELDKIEYPFQEITIKSFNENKIKFKSKSKKGFTVRELIECIKDVENIARPESEWFGGIDAHHIFFEGLGKIRDGIYEIYWGS